MIPDGLNASEAGPLLCGGIAMFNPMVQAGLSPTDSVGVIGIGGLGHMGLKFAAAWGCHVTAFTSDSKRQEAIDMGAHDTINSRTPEAIKAAVGRFDLVLSTVNDNSRFGRPMNSPGSLKSSGSSGLIPLKTQRPHGRAIRDGQAVADREILNFPFLLTASRTFFRIAADCNCVDPN